MEQLKELYSLLNKIKSMPYSTQKMVYIDDYLMLCSYLESLHGYNYEELISLLPYDKAFKRRDYYRSKVNGIFEIEYSDVLHDIMYDYLKIVPEDKLFLKEIIRLNDKKMKEYLEDFFAYLGDDVLKHYRELRSQSKINEVEWEKISAGGLTFSSNSTLSPILLGKRDDYYDYFNAAHEMGHSYTDKIVAPTRKFQEINYFTEVPSTTFEFLFLDFLRTNQLINANSLDTIEKNYKVNLIECFKAVYLYDLMDDGLTYGTDIHFDDVLNEMNNIILPSLKVELGNMYSYRRVYAVGHILSRYFIDYIKEDKINGFKELKNLVMLSNKMNVDDVLKDIPIEPTKKLIKSL